MAIMNSVVQTLRLLFTLGPLAISVMIIGSAMTNPITSSAIITILFVFIVLVYGHYEMYLALSLDYPSRKLYANRYC
jgi:hypothetical protein